MSMRLSYAVNVMKDCTIYLRRIEHENETNDETAFGVYTGYGDVGDIVAVDVKRLRLSNH